MRGNTITAVFRGQREAKTAPLYQYDYGQRLTLADLSLPASYEVHFGTSVSGATVTMIGGPDGVDIPDILLTKSGRIYAWIYLHNGTADGETEYMVTIPVSERGEPTDQEPTPVQQSAIDAAIAALTNAVETVDGIAEAIPETINDALEAAKESGEFDGQDGRDGQDGQNGQDGRDGVSPVISVRLIPASGDIPKSYVITITDATGEKTVTLSDGINGKDGKDGDPGMPGRDGVDGINGAPGAPGKNGEDGAPGADGADGVTFTPSVAADGTISWTNDGGRQNPSSVNIKGPQGDPGDDYVLTAQDKADIAALVGATEETVSGTTPSIVADANHRYICGQVSTISFTPSVTGICDVVFSCGTTAAVLTVPSTVKWPAWFDPTDLDANTVYELNVMDGVYGAVTTWVS